jgi:type III pantothenate kinase
MDQGKLLESGNCNHADLDAGWSQFGLNPETLAGACWCSVVPPINTRLQESLRHFLSGKPIVGLHHKGNLGIPIHYPRPEEIGQDRLANAIGAAFLYGVPAIVIDMGTATTFDIVSQSGGYEGGIIAPGMGLMTRYLHEQTALLPKLDSSELVAGPVIGKSTREAMRSGCVIGFTGMILALLDSSREALKQLGETGAPSVILTGGSAGSLWRNQLPDFIWNPDLTLMGLEYYFTRNS